MLKQNDIANENFSASEDDQDFMNETGDSKGEFELDDVSDNEGGSSTVTEKNNKRKVTDDDSHTTSKKRKKLGKDLYKPPTVEELNQLRETETLFHSNLFRLQIEEVLNEVRIKPKYKRLFDAWFNKFKGIIESIDEHGSFGTIDKTEGCVPIQDLPNDTKMKFHFCKPSNISVIGSYAFDAIIGPNITIDVMIEMPDVLFQKHDFQNYKYFLRKATYLSHINSFIGEDVATRKKYIGSSLTPILKIVPSGKLGKKVNIHIHLSTHEAAFNFCRFLPGKNSVRPKWFFVNENRSDDTLIPTPYYNMMVLRDLTMSRMNSENIMIKEYPNLRDGIILLKIWLTQRQLLSGPDAFGSHVITTYVLYLLRIKKLNTFMSSYQIIRNVWNCLAQSNWCQNGITMCQTEDNEKRATVYLKYYDCVFLDVTGFYNLATHITKETFLWVQREAELSLKHLDNVHVDSFQSLFMQKIQFYRAFDHLISFHNTKALENLVDSKSTATDKLTNGFNRRKQAVKIIMDLLKRGLGNRVRNICTLPDEYDEWECTEKPPGHIKRILIGLELNPDYCFDIVDKGPEANLPEAADFRKFWGDKSELRRFQDGSIREAVVWGKGKSLAEKRIICKKITIFLLSRDLNFSNFDFKYIANQVESLLIMPHMQITHFQYGTGEGAALRAIQSFDALEKELVSITDVPLSINGVQGSSATFRYTEVFPPVATVPWPAKGVTKVDENYLKFTDNPSNAVPRHVHPLEATLQLSTSGKWPEELEAIRKTKAAFHIQIAECLRKQYQLKAQGNASHVDVLKDGFVFRLRVAHQKEIALLKQQVGEDGVIRYRENEESVALENKLFHLPKLTGALHGLYSQQPSFGPTCCLAKRWLFAQLLDDFHVPQIAVELLVASMYLTPEPYKPAHTPQVAFLRFLEMLSRKQWSTDPIIVNFNSEMSKEEILEIETFFGTSRDSLPPLFISTPYDQRSSVWTKKAPTVMILNRISALATESLKLFEERMYTKLDCRPIFRPPLSEFDCLIHLEPLANPRRIQAVDVPDDEPIFDCHPFKPHPKQRIPIVDFDPIQCFLRDLRESYDEFALFFHDTYGGMVIGVVLKPPSLEAKDFKVAHVNCRKLDNDNKLILNVAAMIQDFYILGKGLVRSIEVPNKNTIT